MYVVNGLARVGLEAGRPIFQPGVFPLFWGCLEMWGIVFSCHKD